MKTYRVAILGCRVRGTQAAQAYHAHPRTEVVALCDLLQERLDALGDELGVSARYTDLDAMIEETRPDIVAIPTGTEFHYDLAMRVLEHGVNIEVEKPICVDLAQADEVIAKAREKGVRVAVHHQGRVDANARAVERVFRKGAIGDLRYIYGGGKGYYGGYGMMNIATHVLNSILEYGGRCHGVSAVALTGGRPITPEDVVPSPSGMGAIAGEHITATLELESGVTANLMQHRFPRVDSTDTVMVLFGTEGRLMWSFDGAWFLPVPHYLPGEDDGGWERLEPLYLDHYDPDGKPSEADYSFVDEYVNALHEGRDHRCSGEEGRHVVEIIMGAFESAAYGVRVALPQARRDHPLLRWRRENGLSDPAPMPRDVIEWQAAEDDRLARR